MMIGKQIKRPSLHCNTVLEYFPEENKNVKNLLTFVNYEKNQPKL